MQSTENFEGRDKMGYCSVKPCFTKRKKDTHVLFHKRDELQILKLKLNSEEKIIISTSQMDPSLVAY